MNLNQLSAILGEWKESLGHPKEYYLQRGCFIDARGRVEISPQAHIGLRVSILSQGHSFDQGVLSPSFDRYVIVKAGAWICSNALLYNCEIGEQAIVASGCVVCGQDVAPRVMVAGNPAQVIGRMNDAGHWEIARTWKRRLE